MPRKTTTRVELTEAVYDNVGLPRSECAGLVDMVLRKVTNTLSTGESVKISSFGTFRVRSKNARIGRNPRTGQEALITPRRVVTFRASNILKKGVQTRSAN